MYICLLCVYICLDLTDVLLIVASLCPCNFTFIRNKTLDCEMAKCYLVQRRETGESLVMSVSGLEGRSKRLIVSVAFVCG